LAKALAFVLPGVDMNKYTPTFFKGRHDIQPSAIDIRQFNAIGPAGA
jgi:hypothetical protein